MATRGDRFGVNTAVAPMSDDSTMGAGGAGAGSSSTTSTHAVVPAAAVTTSSSPVSSTSQTVTSSSPKADVLAVEIKNLNFNYGTATKFKPVLNNLNMVLPKGSRTLLVGDNGAGKSTLLRILAGKHLHNPEDGVLILGRSAFYDTSLNNHRSYLGTDWGRRTVAFSGHGCAINADIAVREMMATTQAEFTKRRDELVELLGVDLDWRMHQLSDGQRRRVQIMLQLLRPVDILLLDEITTDLDLITRQDFLQHLKHLTERDGATIIYATHIFDGLDDWPTHLAYVNDGMLAKFGPISDFPEFIARKQAVGTAAPLLRTIESWLREARDIKKAKGRKLTEKAEYEDKEELRGATGNGYLPGRFSQGYA